MTSRNGNRSILAVGLVLALHGAAGAQGAADKAAADTLFKEGSALIATDAPAACAKFEASVARLPQLGAQRALAACYEKIGKTASAWGAYRALAAAAARAHDARQQGAEKQAAALEARLSRLAVKLDPANRVAGLELKRDGAPIAMAELGTPVPVDPGEHTIEATAPGRVAWSSKIAIAAGPGVTEVAVPALEQEPAAPVEPPPPAPAPSVTARDDARGQRHKLAYVVGGAGLGVIGVSLVFGGLASSKWSDAKSHCTDGRCDQEGVDLAGSARTMGNVSTAAFLAGAGALAAGVYLYLSAPAAREHDPTALRIVPGVAPSQVGVTLQGGF
jgi:hypothetical protein